VRNRNEEETIPFDPPDPPQKVSVLAAATQTKPNSSPTVVVALTEVERRRLLAAIHSASLRTTPDIRKLLDELFRKIEAAT
jgi:hypothetical protein